MDRIATAPPAPVAHADRPARRRPAGVGRTAMSLAAIGVGVLALAAAARIATAPRAAVPGPPPYTTPQLAGMPMPAVRAALWSSASRVGLPTPVVRTRWGRYSEVVGRGRVLGQSPGPNEVLRDAPAVVLVTLSRGTARTRVPAAAPGSDPGTLAAALRARRLRVARVREASWAVPAGLLVGTRPAPGAAVLRPATVTLVVSAGPPADPAAATATTVATTTTAAVTAPAECVDVRAIVAVVGADPGGGAARCGG
jgi:serine/threonine-protein kinase